jgi:hypothetical protein
MGKYVKGLFKDTSPMDQPEGSWRYARNITIHPVDGALSNENGMEPLSYKLKGTAGYSTEILPMGAIVLGTIEITDDRVILFLTFDYEQPDDAIDRNALEAGINSEIGLLKGNTYKTLYRPIPNHTNTVLTTLQRTDVDLNFHRDKFIEGTYKINPEEELFVYWVDDLNPPRTINITRQEEWIDKANGDCNWPLGDNSCQDNPRTSYLYGIDYTQTTNVAHKRMLDLFPSSGPVPRVEFNSVNPGGNLLTGAYYLALAYVDRDLVGTNYVVLSNPVSLVEDTEGVLPIERYDGAPAKISSGKAITWKISNLNEDYEFVRPVVIRKADGQNMAFQLNDIPIQNLVESENLVFTGLEGYGESSVDSVIIDTVAYDSAKTINQLDGGLYLGNLKGSKDLGYQKYANFIKARPTIYNFPYFDPHEITLDVLEHGYIETDPLGTNGEFGTRRLQGYRHNQNIFKYKGYMRDEVYAFYIAFLLHDGTESYAYHIPGRAPLQMTDSQSMRVPVYAEQTAAGLTDVGRAFFPATATADVWESGDINSTCLNQITNDAGRIFHFYETSYLLQSNAMNYWQNTTEFYPSDSLNRHNWEIWDAETGGQVSEFVTDVNGNNILTADGDRLTRETDLIGRRVRHHHFPSNEQDHFKVIGENTSTLTIDTDVKDLYTLDFSKISTMEVDDNNPSAIQTQLANEDAVIPCCGEVDPDDNPWDGADWDGTPWSTDGLFLLDNIQPNPNSTATTPVCPDGGGGHDVLWPDLDTVVRHHVIKDTGPRKCGSYDPCVQYPGTTSGFITGGANIPNADVGYTLKQGGYGEDGIEEEKDCEQTGREWGTGDGYKNVYFSSGCIQRPVFNTGINATGSWSEPDSSYYTVMNGAENNNSMMYVLYADPNTGIIVLSGGPWAGCGNGVGGIDFDTLMDCGDGMPNSAGGGGTDQKGFITWEYSYDAIDEGYIQHYVRPMGIQFADVKVPQEIHEKTQGFRIYYAKREHHDRRILGQNLLNPYVPTEQITFPSCNATVEGDETLDSGLNVNKEHFWVNWPYVMNADAYRLPSEGAAPTHNEYVMFSFYDFYLMRGHGSTSGGARKSVTSATHIKLDLTVQMLPFVGPGVKNSEADDFIPGSTTPANCLDTDYDMTLGYHVGWNYFNPNDTTFIYNGGTGGQRLYSWLATGAQGSYDLNRAIKERCKTYVKGDSIYNGKQLGFGYKIFNDFGESHLGFMLGCRGSIPAFQPSPSTGMDPIWINHDVDGNMPMNPSFPSTPESHAPLMYQANLHAFRLDMYNSIDTQDLVWTGYEVTGEDYNYFKVDEIGQPLILPLTADTGDFTASGGVAWHNTYFRGPDNVPTIATVDGDGDGGDGGPSILADGNWQIHNNNSGNVGSFCTGHVYGGDTFICRYGYRKTLRNNLDENPIPINPWPPDDDGNRDIRFIYTTIVETTDNVNFRHIETKKDSYWPATPVKDLLTMKNLNDSTDVDNIKYNEDYSATNDVGHTVPLPLQIIQPTNLPTRVIRSTISDHTRLADNYRVFLAAQFKELPKNRGELWKISVLNNLLYFHMEDSIFKTKGKQTMQMSDGSDAFIGSGDLFVQAPEEEIQTEAGYGGTQSQWATAVGNFGYFYLDQKNATVYMLKDRIYDISSLGLNKWFQLNIPYKLSWFGKQNFVDNPLTFGFIAQWEEHLERILLTKRELTPHPNFRQAFTDYIDTNFEAEFGWIRHNADCDCFQFANPLYGFNNWVPLDYNTSYQYIDSEDSEEISVLWDLPSNDMVDQVMGNVTMETELAVSLGISTGGPNDTVKVTIPIHRYFNTDGWTASYSPKIGAWVSFHDYVPYMYTYTSTDIYSFRMFDTFTASDGALGQSPSIHRMVWRHNFPNVKGNYYGVVYPSEVEVVHNEEKYVNKLFHNFCMITENIPQASDARDYNDCPQCGISDGADGNIEDYDIWMNNLNLTKVHSPGWDSFVLWNQHQCSGWIAFEELVNTRKNGCEWCVNKFRDMTRNEQRKPKQGTSNTQYYYDLFTANPYAAQAGGGEGFAVDSAIGDYLQDIGYWGHYGPTIEGQSATNSIPPNKTIWYVSDMHETLDTSNIFSGSQVTIFNQEARGHTPRKFVDKWLAIRLINRNYDSFLVNLYSTKVGTRKYPRHE